MKYTRKHVLQYTAENDVKFIKLFFTDILGFVKSVSIMSNELEHAFESGISFNAASVRGFAGMNAADLYLSPDSDTLAVLPWRPQQGRVVRLFCNVVNPDRTPFAGDSRRILARVAEEAAALGLSCNTGTECGFYLFETDEKGLPTRTPQDTASYCDLAPRDKAENIRREICLTLKQMGLEPETSRHESGPGQQEIVFRHSDILAAADNLTTFKIAVQTVAARNGLFASFLPKPVEGASGSGLHINLSLYRDGKNLFASEGIPLESSEQLLPEAQWFIAGILRRSREITAFLNPLRSSYARFGAPDAPRYVSWAPVFRSHLVRIPAATGEYARMELRSPDPACNHYAALALVLAAGIEGIRDRQALQPPSAFDACRASPAETAGLEKLPESLAEAAALAETSEFAARVLSGETTRAYIRLLTDGSEPEFGEI